MKHCVALVLVYVGALASLRGQADERVARLDEVVRDYASHAYFAGTVLVAQHGEILLSQGYGLANREWNIPNAPTTRFRIGSVSKQFTAACILLLEERGRLRVDDLVKTHLPDAPAAWDKVTLFHLLTHTSGIPNYTSFPEYKMVQQTQLTPEQLVALFRHKPLEFEPGTKGAYSNSGYALLGYLIEKISNRSYPDFVRENIFTPLGMEDSGYDMARAIIPRRAAGYAIGPDGPVNAEYINMSVPFSAGALYSTTEDLLRWERALFGGELLQPPSLKKMITPFLHGYALGVATGELHGRELVGHGGGIEGFASSLIYFPDDQLTVAVLSNQNAGDVDGLARKLVAVSYGEPVELLSAKKAIDLPRELLAAYVGTYELSPEMDVTVSLEGDQLVAVATGRPKVKLLAKSESEFVFNVGDWRLEFFRDQNGKVTHFVFYDQGREMKAPRKASDSAATSRDRHNEP